MAKIVVVGAGSGGVLMANYLKEEILIFDESTKHTYQPSWLYAGIYGKKERTKLIKDLLPKNVTYKNEKITKVDLANRTVYSKNAHYQYDKLIMASGSKPSPEKITGLDTLSQKYGDIFTNEQQSLKFWQNLNSFKGGKLVVGVSYPIYKFPPVALEAVFLIEENLRKRRIRDKTKIFFFAPFTGAYPAKPMDEVIQPILHKKGIELLAPFDLDTVDMEKRVLNSLEGDSLNFDLALIVPPFTGTDAMPENIVTEDGYIATDKQKLNIKGFEDAFAIGDVASIPSAKSGATTHLEAKVLAKRLSGIDAKYDGRTNCPFEVGDGKATFVIGNYTTETAKIVPKRSYYYMKKFSGRIYWSTIKGKYEWLYDWYFNYMNPKKMLEKYA